MLHAMSPAVPPTAAPSSRSAPVTVLAWLVIVASAVVTPISVISFLMWLVGSYGTKTGSALDWLTIVAGPPVTFLAGIGLLRRARWARLCLLALLITVLAWNGYGILRGPTPEHTYTSAGGVPTTVLASEATYSLPIIAICTGLIAMLCSAKVRAEFAASAAPVVKMETAAAKAMSRGDFDAAEERDIARGWRVGHRGRDQMFYEEMRDGAWQWIEIDGEMLMGRAHHVIYFASRERWQGYPEWARGRRDEIIARIKSEFREPDYEYHGEGEPARPPQSVQNGPAAGSVAGSPGDSRQFTRVSSIAKTPPWQTWTVSLLVAAMLLALAGWMFWLVKCGMEKGVATFPSRRVSDWRPVSRQYEPVEFWFSIGLYSVIGVGAFGLVVWGIRVVCKERKSGRA
jgi:hypothetical protein